MRSRTIQKLDASAGVAISNRSSAEIFIASATITAGQWVQFDDAKTGTDRVLYVKPASAGTATGNPLVCGVALEAASANGTVKVCVAGYCAAANVDNGVAAAGVALVVDNTGTGIANAIAAADTTVAVGATFAAASGGSAPVWVFGIF